MLLFVEVMEFVVGERGMLILTCVELGVTIIMQKVWLERWRRIMQQPRDNYFSRYKINKCIIHIIPYV